MYRYSAGCEQMGGVTILDKQFNKIFELNDESIIDLEDEKLLEIRKNIIE